MIGEPKFEGVISPNGSRNNRNALIIGLILPAIFFGLQEVLNKKVRSLKELRRALPNAKIVGLIPLDNSYGETPILSSQNSIISESFRTLRTKLGFIAPQSNKKIILFSSCRESEGKSFCSVNTAISFAMSGKKTLIINYDLRRPRAEKILNPDSRGTGMVGLSEYLNGMVPVEKILTKCETENLYMIPAGTIPPNPSELIESQTNKELLKNIKNYFDIIILDTPPVGSISDAQLLQPFADIFVFVVKNNQVESSHLSETYKTACELSKNICVVFNGATNNDREYRYYYSNGYYTHKSKSK